MSTHQITRYQLPRFRRPQPNTTGYWVRYCDYVQDMENADRHYQRALNKIEVIKEQLDKTSTIRDGAKRIADQHHNDNQVLRKQLEKTQWLLPIIVTAAMILSSIVTVFVLKGG